MTCREQVAHIQTKKNLVMNFIMGCTTENIKSISLDEIFKNN